MTYENRIFVCVDSGRKYEVTQKDDRGLRHRMYLDGNPAPRVVMRLEVTRKVLNVSHV